MKKNEKVFSGDTQTAKQMQDLHDQYGTGFVLVMEKVCAAQYIMTGGDYKNPETHNGHVEESCFILLPVSETDIRKADLIFDLYTGLTLLDTRGLFGRVRTWAEYETWAREAGQCGKCEKIHLPGFAKENALIVSPTEETKTTLH